MSGEWQPMICTAKNIIKNLIVSQLSLDQTISGLLSLCPIYLNELIVNIMCYLCKYLRILYPKNHTVSLGPSRMVNMIFLVSTLCTITVPTTISKTPF